MSKVAEFNVNVDVAVWQEVFAEWFDLSGRSAASWCFYDEEVEEGVVCFISSVGKWGSISIPAVIVGEKMEFVISEMWIDHTLPLHSYIGKTLYMTMEYWE
jgi:hypothetical protein